MKGTIRYLEEELGLTVNREKSQVAPIKEISLSGISGPARKDPGKHQAQSRFKDRVRELIRRNNPPRCTK